MNARSMAKAGLVLMGAWAFAAGPAVGQEQGRVKQIVPITAPGLVQNLNKAKGGLQNVAPRACVSNSIACGQTRTGNLTSDDCVLDFDNSFYDVWFFAGTAGQTVTINMTSTAVDSYLLLAEPDDDVPVEDDNGGPGASDARIVYTLDTSGQWALIANTANGGETGAYTVSISCTGTSGGTAPAAPTNLTGSPLSSTEVSLSWRDNSNNETGFRIESRIGNGTFVDIGTVGANSTGATVEQLAPNTTYSFRVRATNASGNSAYTNAVTVTTPQGTGGGGFITTPEFPDFRFRILINGQPARRENDCMPDTLCVSGAVPGRAEVFVRIVGPRANGFLWPNIIKFTTSRVEVEIQQISRGATKTYVLPGVDASSNDLIGFFDRTGFLP
jgi:Fibronectin type III domain